MRPLRLDIAGFAAFRDPITVDFTDADYFALTGPTGSGKSTVIDAMTFALYGSAPRWGRENAIQYALAPTATRCAVRLVFDVADRRYVVAREVRRSGKQISQKNPRLERYLDPAATGDPAADEATESLAADTRTVRSQVTDLLGLDFDDFCTCVVLPQGEFATFLTAGVAERQTILLKLLGARHYEAIGRSANRRATEAGARADALRGQLSGYADASEAAETTARQREQALAALAEQAAGQVGDLTSVLTHRAEIDGRLARLSCELELLTAVRAPAGIEDHQRCLAAAEDAYAEATRVERDAGDAERTAEEAWRAGPQRAPLEETLRWHVERAETARRRPGVAEAERAATAELTQAARVLETAEHDLERARTDHDRCRTEHRTATETEAALQAQVAALSAVRVPDGTTDLDRAATAARRALASAIARLEGAESTLAEASGGVAALPDGSALTALQRTVDEYTTADDQLTELRRQLAVATRDSAAAERSAVETRAGCDTARTEIARLTSQAAAAGLRPHLQVGHNCPVCDQPVALLPPPLSAPELDAARTALRHAEAAQQAAESARNRAQTRLAGLTSQLEVQVGRTADLDRRLSHDLPGQPGGDARDPSRDRGAIAGLRSRLAAATAAERTALRERDRAREALRVAERERDRVEEQTRTGWQLLHSTHGRVSSLGAPALPGRSLGADWTALMDWSQALAARLHADLDLARTDITIRGVAVARAADLLRQATAAVRDAGERRTAAAVADSAARTEHRDLGRRLDELDLLLTDRPSELEARSQLTEHQRLEAAAVEARARAQEARLARQQTEAERDRQRVTREEARAALRRAREPLLALGVPVVDDSDLRAGWTQLVSWAGDQAADHGARLAGLGDELAASDRDTATRLTDLDALLMRHDLAPTGLDAEEVVKPGGSTRLLRVPTDVAVAVERARAATAEIARRRREAERLRATIADDTESEQVARELAQLMSARRFPQWLANEALDALVVDASASLLELSGGQFELTHDKGEFFVIDHTDADSPRSVKTLSGGETFQASLALALALAEQLATLAAGGRTTLDSIFLDEGFGTLDPEALEVVASTLENLAQGRRMVGVVTHVPALAERVPVRFEVRRDSRTSTIRRAGP